MPYLLDSAYFGIPQSRSRIYIVGLRKDIYGEFSKKTICGFFVSITDSSLKKIVPRESLNPSSFPATENGWHGKLYLTREGMVCSMIRYAEFCTGVGGFRLGIEASGLRAASVYTNEIDNNCERVFIIINHSILYHMSAQFAMGLLRFAAVSCHF